MACFIVIINVFTYSCGNQVFAVDTTGKLIWKSMQYAKTGYYFNHRLKLSPIVYPHGYIIDTASKVLYALCSSNGSEIGSYKTPFLVNATVCDDPPFIVANRIPAQNYIKSYLFSAPLKYLIKNKLFSFIINMLLTAYICFIIIYTHTI